MKKQLLISVLILFLMAGCGGIKQRKLIDGDPSKMDYSQAAMHSMLVQLDADANGAIDREKGGTNTPTAAGEQTALSIDHLFTLSGRPEGSDDLGTGFTGTTIPDSANIVEALQAIETAVEAIEASLVSADWIKSSMIDWSDIPSLDEGGMATDFALNTNADAGNFDIHSIYRLFGVDDDIYINMGTDGVLQAIADTRIDLQAPDIRLQHDASNYLDIAVGSGGATIIKPVGTGTPSITIGVGTYNFIVNAANWSIDSSGNLIVNGTVSSAAVSGPWYSFLDSDNPGTDKEIARVGGNYISGGDGAENGDFLIQSMEGGTETLRLRFDQANQRWDFQAYPIKTTSQAISNFTSIIPQALSVTTETNITVGTEITSGIIDMTGDDDADHDTLDLQDAPAAYDGVIITFTAIAACDASDNIVIDAETDSTCTGCPTAGIFTLDSVGDSVTLRWNNTAAAWFYVGSYDAS